MLSKKILFTLCCVVTAIQAFSQTYSDDLLRYSRTTFSGTSRTQSIGGAQTSVGGDLGSLSANPAGLGFFRRSDFSVTPTFTNAFIKSNYLGGTYSNSKNNLDFGNMGVVWATSTPQADEGRKSAGWLSYAFGIGYTRTADFNSNFSFAGKNSANSFTSFLADRANAEGVNFDQNKLATDNNIPGQAYNGYLINGVNNPSSNVVTYYPTSTPNAQNPVTQSASNYQAGSINDINLSFGTNYGNVLYLGIGANISTLHYTYGYNFSETGIIDQRNNAVTGLGYSENFDAAGTGFSAKGGLIFRPVESFRIGAYVQTPTWYHITEATNNAQVLGINASGQNVYTPTNPDFVDYSYNYSIKTPWRYNFGASYFIKSYAFLSGDVELVDYRTASFHSGDVATNSETNMAAQHNYTSAVNYRLGAEVKLGLVSLRAGYAIYGNPYSAPSLLNSQATSITGGLGYRYRNIYVDAALVNTKYNSSYQAYPVNATNGFSPTAALNTNRTDVMITIGNRF